MKIQFYIRFYTHQGQSMQLSGNSEEMGSGDFDKAFPLTYLNHEYWHGTIDVDPDRYANIQYRYLMTTENGECIAEGGEEHILDISKSGIEEIRSIDTWNHAGNYENVFYTDPFQEVLLKDYGRCIKTKSPNNFTHIFKVRAPLLAKNEAVCIIGGPPSLGSWDTVKPLLLSKDNESWTIKINLGADLFPLDYKYGIFNTKNDEFLGYESGENRKLEVFANDLTLTVLQDGFARFTNQTWKGAGVSIPVFSLRSKDSFGVGEFNDLKLLVDWAGKTGLKLIQILPVNDTIATHTWTDSYPYAAISAFALHPLYLNLETMAGKHSHYLIRPLKKKQKQLNELSEIDYEQVISFKCSCAREVFLAQKKEFLKDPGFLEFFDSSRHWLIPYAAFCYLRDRNGTSDFTKWKMYSEFNRSSIEKYVSPKAKHYDNIAFSYFLQYHLHLQLKDAVGYARKNGVIIKGDIPIGVFRYGCDTWMDPELFNMELQSGAPPDLFAVKGQNWGFPTYNWQKMAEDKFEWWHKRFEQMSKYFDAFRIDHILGFFRIWSIPIDSVQGIMGYFEPSLPIHVYEFGQRGMWFNYYRFCKPYINDTVLWELFGPNKEKFLPFLSPVADNQYELKEGYHTQQEVAAWFESQGKSEENQRLCEGLFELISNVILFEHKGSNGQEFHFRISMENSSSYRHLDWNSQQRLREMYIDYFYKRQNEFWKQQAMQKLPALKRSTNMLICGEDLGMVPDGVPQVMKQLGILSLEIQRMPKDPGSDFFNLANAPYLSVVTPSTHDMSTIRGWWEEDPAVSQKFYNEELKQPGEAPASCGSWICRTIIQQHLFSPAIWSIFQLQDLLGIDENLRRDNPDEERINIPVIPQFYWRYRMHIPLEELIKEKEFNTRLKEYIAESGRA